MTEPHIIYKGNISCQITTENNKVKILLSGKEFGYNCFKPEDLKHLIFALVEAQYYISDQKITWGR